MFAYLLLRVRHAIEAGCHGRYVQWTGPGFWSWLHDWGVADCRLPGLWDHRLAI